MPAGITERVYSDEMIQRRPGAIKDLLENDVRKSSQQQDERCLKNKFPASLLEEIIGREKDRDHDVGVAVTQVGSTCEILCQSIAAERNDILSDRLNDPSH